MEKGLAPVKGTSPALQGRIICQLIKPKKNHLQKGISPLEAELKNKPAGRELEAIICGKKF
jgi:hypothetical protein